VKSLLSSKVLLGCSVAFALAVLTGYAVFRPVESPSAVLKHALHLRAVPHSVGNLRMGSDVWTDEVRCFSFTIASAEFDQLLAGREFKKITYESPKEARTIHISPAVSVSGHTSYRWQTNGAYCVINPDDSHEHVIVVFIAD
jgi:hypothetical protein